MNLDLAAATLENNLSKLSDKDQSFAGSLLDSYYGNRCSEKQAMWIVKLAERTVAPAPATEQVGDMSGVYALFETAKASGLKFPKIVAKSPVGEIKLSVAGPNARVPGSINVVEAGAAFGEAKFYGRITKDGSFEGRSAPTELLGYLREFAAKPAEMAALHGKQTGCCCFCAKELTDARSIEVGYGPTCAGHYGLPWGDGEAAAKPAKRDVRKSFIATFGKRSAWAA